MISPKVGATASLVMFLIVCTGCIHKDLVEARKIEVIKQSDEPVYHDDPKAAPSPHNIPEDMDKSIYHTDYHGPCHNGGCWPPMDEDLVEARKIEVIKQSDEPVYHDGPTAAPPSHNTPEDMDEFNYHTDYHGPCHNGGCWPPNSLHNNLEDMDKSVYHTDYPGVSTHPSGPPNNRKT